MTLAQNGKTHSSRTKHIDIKYFFLSDRIKNGDMQLKKVGTEKMIADGLTKPLQGTPFRIFAEITTK